MGAGGSDQTTMTSHDAHPAPAHGSAPANPAPGDGHGEHGHAADTLGPVDVRMWAVGVLGVIAAVVVTAGLVVATSFRFGA